MTENKEQNPIEGLKDNASAVVEKAKNISGERGWSMACYIPVFNIIACPLCAVRMVASKLCRFHSRQGLALFSLWMFTIFIALISQTLSLMLWGITLLLHIAGVVIAYTGSETKIPLLGQLAVKIPEYHIFEILTGKKPEALDVEIEK